MIETFELLNNHCIWIAIFSSTVIFFSNVVAFKLLTQLATTDTSKNNNPPNNNRYTIWGGGEPLIRINFITFQGFCNVVL